MPSRSMRALVLDGPGRIGVRDIPRPSAGPGEVLLRVRHCGVCGTDLQIVSGRYAVRAFPLVIGHEFAGEVVATGQAVTVDGIKSCGACHQCRRGSPALCDCASELGIHEPGGLAEYVAAPSRNVHPLPTGMSTLEGALVEPLACAIHGQDRVGVRLGDTVAVVGAGAQGLMHAALARHAGAARVIVSGRHAPRRRRAAAMGADLVLDPERDDPATQVLEATGGQGADVAIEASGSAAGCADAVRMVRRGGRVLLYGAAPPDAPLPASPWDVFERELTILGSFGATPDTWPRAIELIHRGRIEVAGLVDAQWALEDAPHALDQLAGDRALVKGVIEVRDRAGPCCAW